MSYAQLEESFTSISDTKSITREIYDVDDKSLSNQLDELFARKGDEENRFDAIFEFATARANTEKKDRVNFNNYIDLKSGNQLQNTPHFVSDSSKVTSSSERKPTKNARIGNHEDEIYDQFTPR